MAETVKNSASDADEQHAELERIVPSMRRPATPGVVYGGRFMLAYLILVVVFGGLTALVTYLVVREETPAWSSFKPRGEGLARATSIANHVAKDYRSGNTQVAVVEAQPPVVENSRIDVIAVARDQILEVGGGFITVEPADRSLFYVMCGLGQACSLSRNTDASQTLLRREALELSLYTFKYMKNIDSVVTLLPPRGEETQAIYLRRRGYEQLLEKPLHRTLSATPPYSSATIGDAPLIDQLTEHREFPAYFQRISNGSVMLRLGGPPPEDPPQTAGGGGQNP
jgi:hypothetical protein